MGQDLLAFIVIPGLQLTVIFSVFNVLPMASSPSLLLLSYKAVLQQLQNTKSLLLSFLMIPSNYRDTAMEAYPHPSLGFYFFVAGSHVIQANLKVVI